MVAWFIVVAIAIAVSALSLVLMPRPKTPKPDAATDLDDPVAEAGKPIPVVFGEVMVKGLNVLWFGDKKVKTIKVSA